MGGDSRANLTLSENNLETSLTKNESPHIVHYLPDVADGMRETFMKLIPRAQNPHNYPSFEA